MSNFKLCDSLQKLLNDMRKDRAFDAKDWIPKKAKMLNDYMREHGLSGCVISVSGGVDSAVTLALIHRAKQEKDSPIKRIVAICQPINSTKEIWERALELKCFKGVEIITVDQSSLFDELKLSCDKAIGIDGGRFESGQLRSYMRTPVNYYMAQLVSQAGNPAVVVGTGNYDEDSYLFYYSKCGDGVSDVQLIFDLHKSEVFTVGKELNVPQSILEAAPSADLWAGQTDEQELGFTYDFVELYTEFIKHPLEKQAELRKNLDGEGQRQFEEWEKLITAVHKRNKHKEVFPVNLNISNI